MCLVFISNQQQTRRRLKRHAATANRGMRDTTKERKKQKERTIQACLREHLVCMCVCVCVCVCARGRARARERKLGLPS
jgi:hypothetical protein